MKSEIEKYDQICIALQNKCKENLTMLNKVRHAELNNIRMVLTCLSEVWDEEMFTEVRKRINDLKNNLESAGQHQFTIEESEPEPTENSTEHSSEL